jgi:hypothetical protein
MDSTGAATFGDAAASALLAATAYRAAIMWPSEFDTFYTDGAGKFAFGVMFKLAFTQLNIFQRKSRKAFWPR